MKILSVITARGGSKGVPGKNIREIAGIPLVGYKAIAAHRSKHLSRVIVSTDSPEIQEVAKRYDVEVPFTRPAHLAADRSSSFDVILHAIDHFENLGERYDAVMMLEPSSPFATAEDFDKGVEIMLEHDASLVVGVVSHKIPLPFLGEMGPNGNLEQIVSQLEDLKEVNRQSFPNTYTLNGGFYLYKWDEFKKAKTIYFDPPNSYGYEMSPYYSIEIDEEIDLKWAEFLVEKGYVDVSHWK